MPLSAKGREFLILYIDEARYSILILSPNPKSWIICLISATKLWALWLSTVTENSIPIFRLLPLRNLGHIFVPRRFHTSGGTSPEIRSIVVAALVAAVGLGSSIGSENGCLTAIVVDSGLPSISSGVVFKVLALSFVRRYTPDSKVTSSAVIGSLNHIRS